MSNIQGWKTFVLLAVVAASVQGEARAATHSFKVRIGSAGGDAFKSLAFVVGSSPISRQVQVRRFLGVDPRVIEMSVQVVEGTASWWTTTLSETVFTLGGAPTTFAADVDDPGELPFKLGDGDIDDADLQAFENHYTGDGNLLAPDRTALGTYFDSDGDLDVDDRDRAALQAAHTGPLAIPWNKRLTLTIAASSSAPSGSMARIRIRARNRLTGETHSVFAHVTKQPSKPSLDLQEAYDIRRERDTKLAYGRYVTFDFNLRSLGADPDVIDVSVLPVSGFAFKIVDPLQHGLPVSAFRMGPGSIDEPSLPENLRPLQVQVESPAGWARGTQSALTIVARSRASGQQSRFTVNVIKAGPLWNPSDLTQGGTRHNVRPGKATTFSFTVTNTTTRANTLELTAHPTGAANGWSATLPVSRLKLQPTEQRTLVLKLVSPASAGVGAVSDWLVTVTGDDGRLLSANAVGAQVTRHRKIIYVALDGLDPQYLGLNAKATHPGSADDWLMPNVRSFLETATYYSNAESSFPHYTDPNHFAALSGTRPGSSGIASVINFYYGKDDDGAAVAFNIEDVTTDVLRYGPDGGEVTTLFDVAKQVQPTTRNALVTGKGWMQFYFEKQGGSVDVVAEGRDFPFYIPEPTLHYQGDPASDPDPEDPRYDTSIGNWGEQFGIFPDDRWVMISALKVLEAEDPDVLYVLLAGPDDTSHALGTASDPAEWDDRGTETLIDDINRVNPRAYREDVIDVIREADILFGQLMAKLDERGVRDETYVVLLADHAEITHNARPLRLQTLLESYGYSYKDDFEVLAGSSFATFYGVADSERQRFEDTLEAAPSIAPGLTANPWIVLNRSEMQSGVDARTGRRFTDVNGLYNQYFVENGAASLNLPDWPDFYVSLDAGWSFRPLNFHLGEDPYLPNLFVGGHSGPATARIPLAIAGPNLPRGLTVADPVSIIDIAPTLYALQGWDEPRNVEGRVLPGMGLPPEALDLSMSSSMAAEIPFGGPSVSTASRVFEAFLRKSPDELRHDGCGDR
jgi:predicted AlkP superfamily pyrophosphatase or phosphodiesterase